MFVELKTPPNVFVRCGSYSNTHYGWKGMDFMKVNIYPSTTFYFLEEVIRISYLYPNTEWICVNILGKK